MTTGVVWSQILECGGFIDRELSFMEEGFLWESQQEFACTDRSSYTVDVASLYLHDKVRPEDAIFLP